MQTVPSAPAERFFRLAGGSAYLSAAAMLVGAIIIPFYGSPPLARLGNWLTLLLAISMLPLGLAHHRLFGLTQPALSRAAWALGAASMLAAAGLQALLIAGLAAPAGVADILDDVTFAGIGVWLILCGFVERASGRLPAALPFLAQTGGAGYVLVTLGFLVALPPPPWALAGGFAALAAYPAWAVWLGSRFLAHGQLLLPSAKSDV